MVLCGWCWLVVIAQVYQNVAASVKISRSRTSEISELKFTVMVNAGPHQNQAPVSALNFVKAALAEGHAIACVFFFFDGVHNASGFSAPPQDEADVCAQWSALAASENIELVYCATAGRRRGIAEDSDKRRGTAGPMFTAGGLGRLSEAIAAADRFIVFGN